MIRILALLFTACTMLGLQAHAASIDDLPVLDRSDTLSGPDKNGNGIRDDIDAWIAQLNYTMPQHKALEQLARSLQKAVTVNPSDKNAVRAIAALNTRAINCAFSRFENQDPALSGTLSRKIEAITANTKQRLKNYLAYNKALDGTVSSLPDGDTCE